MTMNFWLAREGSIRILSTLKRFSQEVSLREDLGEELGAEELRNHTHYLVQILLDFYLWS